MSWLSPTSLFWLGLAAPLVALYVLRRTRVRTVVGSTLLWQAALRDLRVERPFQRLRAQVPLLLELAVIAALALALARPSSTSVAPRGAVVGVVVDTSASMGARTGEGDETRLDRARDAARALARSLGEDATMMMVDAGAEAVLVLPRTHERAPIEAALAALAPGGPGSDLEAAIALLSERMREAPSGSEIVVLTDGAGPDVTTATALPVRLVSVGDEAPNDAIVALELRPRAEPGAPDRAELLVRVAHFGAGTTEGALEVELLRDDATSALLARQRITLTEGRPTPITMVVDLPADAAARAPIVRATLVRDGGADALPLDDVAFAPSPAFGRLPVVQVGPLPASVERVLSVDDRLERFELDAAGLADGTLLPPAALFVLADAPAEAATPPGDTIVFAHDRPRALGVSLGDVARAPAIIDGRGDDRSQRFVSWGDVHLGDVRPIVDASAHPLLVTTAGAALARVELGERDVTIFGFDPDASDLPIHPAFVVLFRNLVDHAIAHRRRGGLPEGPLGAPLAVPAHDGADVDVEGPSGFVAHVVAHGDVGLVEVPATPGVYRVRTGAHELVATRHLASPAESDLHARASLVHRDRTTDAEVLDAPVATDLWPLLTALALLLVMADVTWLTRRGAP